MTRRYRGIILGFSGAWQSGIAQLAIGRSENGRDVIERLIPCENGPTARALIAAFDCVGPGHSIDNHKLHGRRIEYTLDEVGLLAAFMPVRGE
jgi:hypothetical protein